MTNRDMRLAVERIIKLWAAKKFAERGDDYATVSDLKNICSDPIAFLDLLSNEDAREVLTVALRHNRYHY